MKIVESYLCGKIDAARCEDAIFTSGAFAAVIDGVSSKTDFRFEGKTTGRLAAELVAGVLGALPPDASLPEFVSAVNEAFARFYETAAFPAGDRLTKGLQAVCAVYSAQRREIWQIGDCQVLADGIAYQNSKKSDRVICAMRSLILDILERRDGESRPAAHDAEALETLFPWMVGVCAFANDPAARYGYCVLNGRAIPEGMVNRIALDGGPHEVILASDGYPRLYPTLAASEQALADILREDPQGRRIFLTARRAGADRKSFDDRSYLRFTVDAV